MIRTAQLVLILVALQLGSAAAQDSGAEKKSLDIKSPVADLHAGNDADLRAVGLPLYPGARPRKHGDDWNSASLSLFLQAFGMKIVVVNYDSDDSPDKLIAYYRDQLKKYGKPLECHSSSDKLDTDVDSDAQDSAQGKELKCKGDNKGDNVELKVGTEANQHVVAIRPSAAGKGSSFALVYVHTRGKQADI